MTDRRACRILLSLGLCLGAVAAASAGEEPAAPAAVTEGEVRGMLAAIERAVAAKDARAATAFLEEDVEIRLTMETPDGEIAYPLTKAEFRAYVEKTMAAMTAVPRRSPARIRILPDGSGAVATDETVLTLDLGELGAMHAREVQKATIRRRGSALKIVALDVEADVQLDGLLDQIRRAK